MFPWLEIGKSYVFFAFPMFILGTLVDDKLGSIKLKNAIRLIDHEDLSFLRTGKLGNWEAIGTPNGEWMKGKSQISDIAAWNHEIPVKK